MANDFSFPTPVLPFVFLFCLSIEIFPQNCLVTTCTKPVVSKFGTHVRSTYSMVGKDSKFHSPVFSFCFLFFFLSLLTYREIFLQRLIQNYMYDRHSFSVQVCSYLLYCRKQFKLSCSYFLGYLPFFL